MVLILYGIYCILDKDLVEKMGIINRKGGIKMKYSKPVVLNPKTVRAAVCGGGKQCGRPCSKRA